MLINIAAQIRLIFPLLVALMCTSSAQTVRERHKDPEFKLYSVIFSFTVDADSKLQAFKVFRVIVPRNHSTDAVDVQVSQAYIDAAKKKAEAKHYRSKIKDGRPVERFTNFLYTPEAPETVITDLDGPLDKQP